VRGELPPAATKRVRRVRVIALSEPVAPGAEHFTLQIDRWHPTRLNELLGHPMRRARQKKADAQLIAYTCRDAGVTRATVPRAVTLTIVLAPRQRAGDPDAYWKSLLDSLVSAGALVNDNRQWCRPMPVQFARAAQSATVVQLDDTVVDEQPEGQP
jgi:hypothetical protein